MLTEAYKFFPEKMPMRFKHQKISSMLAKVLIERKVKEDRLFKSNAEQQESLLSDPKIREWTDLFLNMIWQWRQDLYDFGVFLFFEYNN